MSSDHQCMPILCLSRKSEGVYRFIFFARLLRYLKRFRSSRLNTRETVRRARSQGGEHGLQKGVRIPSEHRRPKPRDSGSGESFTVSNKVSFKKKFKKVTNLYLKKKKNSSLVVLP